MYTYQQKKKPSLLNLFGSVAVFLVFALFAMVSIGTGDILWFWPFFDETPAQITVYCYGKDVALQPGSAAFNELTTIFNESLSGFKNWDNTTMSVESWEDYQTFDQFATLVVSYSEPVRVHSIYKYFTNVEALVVPLDGRHSASNAVFSLMRGEPGFGSLHLETIDQLIEFMNMQGVCSISS